MTLDDGPRFAPLNEILAYIDRDGQRFIVVWFPRNELEDADIQVIPDDPYWWRQEGRFIDRSEECSG